MPERGAVVCCLALLLAAAAAANNGDGAPFGAGSLPCSVQPGDECVVNGSSTTLAGNYRVNYAKVLILNSVLYSPPCLSDGDTDLCNSQEVTMDFSGDVTITNSIVNITSAQISVAGAFTLGQASVLTLSAKGPQDVRTASQGENGVGGGNGGQGASCPSRSRVSGQVTQLLAEPFFFGGAAFPDDHPRNASRGGGRLKLTATTSVSILGQLSADGQECLPVVPLVGGGAGGTVYISTPTLLFGTTGGIYARGGPCLTEKVGGTGGGGGGGVVSLDLTGHVPDDVDKHVHVDGGKSPTVKSRDQDSFSSCSAGGPGIVYFPQQARLECRSDASSVFDVTSSRRSKHSSAAMPRVESLVLQGCRWDVSPWYTLRTLTSLSLASSHFTIAPAQLKPIAGAITLSGQSELSCFNCETDNMAVTATSLSLESSVLTGGRLDVNMSDFISVDSNSYLHFAGPTTLRAPVITVNNEVSQVDLPSANTFTAEFPSTILADQVHIYANSSASIGGTITARHVETTDCASLQVSNTTCEEDRALGFPDYYLIVDSPTVTLKPVGFLRAAILRVCADTIDAAGSIAASANGCPANQGAGPGGHDAQLPGGGGGHGGKGGSGRPSGFEYNAGGVSNDDPAQPVLLGSGGGGDSAGSGGGIVKLEAGSITLNGSVSAHGGEGGPPTYTSRASGGGSGGAVVITAHSFKGSKASLINLQGGAGGSDGGGGGGGGILRLHLVPAMKNATLVPGSRVFFGRVQINGGTGDVDIPGTSGAVGVHYSSPPCSPGYGNGLCLACDRGRYQSEFSPTAQCMDCSPGRHAASRGQSTCETCGTTQFQNASGASWCHSCPKGSLASDDHVTCDNCTYGYGWQPDLGVCLQCDKGYYSPTFSGKVSCQPCPAGTYTDATATSNCTLCPANMYTNRTGSTACRECKAGHVTVYLPYTECVPCPAGFYAPAQSSPAQWLAGRWDAPLGCLPCPTGNYSVAGQSSCPACRIGWRSDANRTSCVHCTSRPRHSHYVLPGPGLPADDDGQCAFECNKQFRASANCLSAVGVAFDVVGWPAWVGIVVVLLVLVLGRRLCFGRQCSGRSARLAPTRTVSASINHTDSHQPVGSALSRGLAKDAAALGYAPLADWAQGSSPTRRVRRQRPSRRQSLYLALEPDMLTRHLHRVYFTGCNSSLSPFALDPVVPPELEALVDPDEYVSFAEEVDEVAAWGWWKHCVFHCLLAFHLPLALLWKTSFRAYHLRRLVNMQDAYDHAFLRNTRAQALRDCIKFGVSECNTLAWLDILIPAVGVDAGGVPVGQPRVPMVVCCAGDGSYAAPYRLELRDPLVIAAGTLLGPNWPDVVLGLNDVLRTIRPGRVDHQPGLRHAQAYLAFANESSSGTVSLALGMTAAVPNVSARSRLAVLFLPDDADMPLTPDGVMPVYLPHDTRPIRWSPRKKGSSTMAGMCRRAVLLPFRNASHSGHAAAVWWGLSALLVLEVLLALLINAGLWKLNITYFWVVLFVWPVAWVVSPLLGLVALMLESPLTHRVHGALNLLSMVNVVLAVGLGSRMSHDLGPELFVLGPILWLIIKVCILALVNVHVAHLEYAVDAALASTAPAVPRPSTPTLHGATSPDEFHHRRQLMSPLSSSRAVPGYGEAKAPPYHFEGDTHKSL